MAENENAVTNPLEASEEAKLTAEVNDFSDRYFAFTQQHSKRISDWLVRNPNKELPITTDFKGNIVWLNRKLRRMK